MNQSNSDNYSEPHSTITRVTNPSVVVRNVSKSYRTRITGQPVRDSRRKFRSSQLVHSLSDVSFVVDKGEAVGILGRNGSGKTTLLSLIAGSESVSSGSIFVSAQPTLLGISAALEPYLSGFKNVELGLLAMGLDSKEVPSVRDEVISFSGLEEAIYRPLKTYSSGMLSRLRFGISTAMRPEILLVDEALGAGDAAFSAKAKDRVQELISDVGTFFLVSHDASMVKQMCNRAIWLHLGEVIADGDVNEVSDQYAEFTRLLSRKEKHEANRVRDRARENFPQILFAAD